MVEGPVNQKPNVIPTGRAWMRRVEQQSEILHWRAARLLARSNGLATLRGVATECSSQPGPKRLRAHRCEGPNMKSRCTREVRRTSGTQTRRLRGRRTPRSRRRNRRASGRRRASNVHGTRRGTNGGTFALMEEVLRREKLVRAYKRVLQNKGAAGAAGITSVGQLATHWTGVREALLNGEYAPHPFARWRLRKREGAVVGHPDGAGPIRTTGSAPSSSTAYGPDLLGRELWLSAGTERTRSRAPRAAISGGRQSVGGRHGPREIL